MKTSFNKTCGFVERISPVIPFNPSFKGIVLLRTCWARLQKNVRFGVVRMVGLRLRDGDGAGVGNPLVVTVGRKVDVGKLIACGVGFRRVGLAEGLTDILDGPSI